MTERTVSRFQDFIKMPRRPVGLQTEAIIPRADIPREGFRRVLGRPCCGYPAAVV